MKETTQRAVGFAAWIALALLQVLWHTWWIPPTAMPRGAAVVLSLVPFVIPLVYWRRPERALLLAGIISLLYFCHGAAVAFAAPAERLPALIEAALAVIVILGCARMPKRRNAAGSHRQ